MLCITRDPIPSPHYWMRSIAYCQQHTCTSLKHGMVKRSRTVCCPLPHSSFYFQTFNTAEPFRSTGYAGGQCVSQRPGLQMQKGCLYGESFQATTKSHPKQASPNKCLKQPPAQTIFINSPKLTALQHNINAVIGQTQCTHKQINLFLQTFKCNSVSLCLANCFINTGG